MTVDTGRNRSESIEAALRRIRGVERVAVVLGDDQRCREIHVHADGARAVRPIIRDIQTLLITGFHESIDHRIVSVFRAQQRTAVEPEAVAASAPDAVAAPEAPAAPEQAPRAGRAADRIRFVSVNLYVSGPRAQAQVELRWKGITRMGSAAGTATRDGAHLLVAGATVAALQEFLEEDWSLGVNGVQFVRLGPGEAVVVGLTLLAHRREKTLAGCCTVEQDVPQAVALATLAALNRVVGGLETREPIEYVLRPTSFQESEAK